MRSADHAAPRSLVTSALLVTAALLASASGCGDDSIEDGGPGGGGGTATATTTTTASTSASPTTSSASTSQSASSQSASSGGDGGAGGGGGDVGGGGAGGQDVCATGERRCSEDGAVEECAEDHSSFVEVETCDEGLQCAGGECLEPCAAAEVLASNAGCTFWAVDLDQQDGAGNDPASEPWGLLIGTDAPDGADVVIEINEAEPGEPAELVTLETLHVASGFVVDLETRELDCGTVPNDYESPGTCLSARALRVTSSAPIVVTQLNTLSPSYSADASLLLPQSALGTSYRVLGWGAGHPIPIVIPDFYIVDRSYVTIVGTQPDTEVTFDASWRVRGNDPIDAIDAGESVTVTLQPFDVLNLETDDGTEEDDPETIADLSGSFVTSDKPVAVFTGVESASAPGALDFEDFPLPPGWDDDTGFLDHLEEQLVPLDAVGRSYVVARSPLRSEDFREADVVRFVGGPVATTVTTTLPAPWDDFTLAAGEVKTTWTQDSFVASADAPFLVGQLLAGLGYTTRELGDPSLVVLPATEQFRSSHTVVLPADWDETYLVLTAPASAAVTIDGDVPDDCSIESAGVLSGTDWESRVCPVSAGVRRLAGPVPFGVVAYGYEPFGSFAFNGGTGLASLVEVEE